LRNKVSAGEYLAFLSLKYEVDPDEFFVALDSAWKNQRANCGKLLIQRRSKGEDKAIFLITENSKVVAQFPIPRTFFQEKRNPIELFRRTAALHRHIASRTGDSHESSSSIRDLRVGMKKIRLKAKVLEIPRPKLVFTRFGNYATVANASVTDETGTVKLCLWNEQISAVSVGDTVVIENASMSMYRGEPQLRIGRKGTINVVEKQTRAEMKCAEIKS
jgi:replication factor A1